MIRFSSAFQSLTTSASKFLKTWIAPFAFSISGFTALRSAEASSSSSMSLKSCLTQQHDFPVRRTSAVGELVELVFFLIRVKQSASSSEAVEDAWFGRVDEEDTTSSLDVGGVCVADGET